MRGRVIPSLRVAPACLALVPLPLPLTHLSSRRLSVFIKLDCTAKCTESVLGHEWVTCPPQERRRGKREGHHCRGCCSYSLAPVSHYITHGDMWRIVSLACMARTATSQVKVSQACHLVLPRLLYLQLPKGHKTVEFSLYFCTLNERRALT